MKAHKMDRHLVATDQQHELDTIVERFRKKEGLKVTSSQIKRAVKSVGHSRRKVYKQLRLVGTAI